MTNIRKCFPVLAVALAWFAAGRVPAQSAPRQLLRGYVPEAVQRFHLQPAGRPAASRQLTLAIGLPLRNEPALDELLREIYDPASPAFRRYLTPEQFAERFGPAAQDYQAVMDFAQANGLKVAGTHLSRLVLEVQGSVADVERAFHVTLRTYRHPHEARDFYAPEAEPALDLPVPVLHVSGLDNYSLPHPAGRLKKELSDSAAKVTPNAGSGFLGSYRGSDFRAAYVPGTSLTGSGQSVALVQFDGYYSNDIALYISRAGLTNYPISLTNVPVNGGVGTPGGNNAEVCLDIEMVIAMAPGVSKIIVYEAPNGLTAWSTILSSIADDTVNLARQISCSWGGGTADPTAEEIFKQMAVQGQSFFNASGDSDAFTGSIPFPSESTNITLVGGTTLSTTGPGGAYVSETVWNAGGGSGSSGGISTTYGRPVWQQDINMTTNQGSTTMRNIPDVALTGDNVYVVYNNGSAGIFGGTSCASPLWAGFMALVNEQAAAVGRPSVGFVNPFIYAIGLSNSYNACFHDVTTGNNTWSGSPTLFYATNGYDLCTGWGSPAGTNLINSLVGFTDPLGVTPSTNFIAVCIPGGAFNVTSQNYALTNWGTAALNWSVISTSGWLNVSGTSGTLTAGGAASNVTVSLTSSTTNLAIGSYVATVWFSNATTHITQGRQFKLSVVNPLQITPSTGFVSTAPVVGSPFSVTAQNYTLTNIGIASLNWSLINTSSWLAASPGSGTLTPGGPATTVAAGLTPVASTLVAGLYSTTLVFTNTTGHLAVALPFTLSIGQSVLQNGGFETGDFTSWTLDGNGPDYNLVDNGSVTAVTPHSGTYFAALGEPYTIAYLSQILSTVPGQNYLLSFWLNNDVGGNILNPEKFSANWNTNAGTTNTLFSLTNPASFSWTNLQFIVVATGTSTTLQFGSQNSPDWFALDDVNVWPIPNPSFRSVVKTNGNNIVFSWNTLAGLGYVVQYSTNLVKTNWVSLSTNTATGPVLTYTNAYGSDPRRFYRIRQLP
jgi:subtilase family serine protease